MKNFLSVLFTLTTSILMSGILYPAHAQDAEIPPRYKVTDIYGKPINEKKGVDHIGFKGLKVTAGMGYQILEIHANLARGQQRIASLTSPSETLLMEPWQAIFQPGDRIIIEVKKVIKKTATDNHAVTVSGGTFVIPIY